MQRLPTIVDVASTAGVSRQTVSNVLNSPDIVKPETRIRVEAAIASLGYHPHESARRLRMRKSSTIGIRLDPQTDGISGSVLDRFLHALTEQAAEQGLRILLFTARDHHDEVTQIERLRDTGDVDAFVLTSTTLGDPRTTRLAELGVSFVTFGRPWGVDDMDDPAHLWVDVDGRSGLHEATSAYLSAGLRRVGYIGWPAGSGSGDERMRGWRDAMLGAGSAPGEPAALDEGQLDALSVAVEDGVSQGAEAFRHLRAAGDVDAVVCASDSLALGALIASGGAIPVTGYDDTPVAAAVGLSSVRQPLDEVAAGVLELLTGAHAGRSTGGPADDPRHRLVRPRLVTRSPAPLPRP